MASTEEEVPSHLLDLYHSYKESISEFGRQGSEDVRLVADRLRRQTLELVKKSRLQETQKQVNRALTDLSPVSAQPVIRRFLFDTYVWCSLYLLCASVAQFVCELVLLPVLSLLLTRWLSIALSLCISPIYFFYWTQKSLSDWSQHQRHMQLTCLSLVLGCLGAFNTSTYVIPGPRPPSFVAAMVIGACVLRVGHQLTSDRYGFLLVTMGVVAGVETFLGLLLGLTPYYMLIASLNVFVLAGNLQLTLGQIDGDVGVLKEGELALSDKGVHVQTMAQMRELVAATALNTLLGLAVGDRIQ